MALRSGKIYKQNKSNNRITKRRNKNVLKKTAAQKHIRHDSMGDPSTNNEIKDSADSQLVTSKNVKEKMRELFSNPGNITAYSRYLKRLFDQLDVPSKHAPRRKKFKRRKTKVHGPFNTYQMDIVDYRSFEYQNNRYRYILTIIDCFTRYAYAIPLKLKDAENTSKAVLEFLNQLNTVPKFIYSDAGLEFTNNLVQHIFKERGIMHFILRHAHKASIVERFNRTLKTALQMHFTASGSDKWVGKPLNSILKNYNNKYHRSIKMAPSQVTLSNFRDVYKTLYPEKSTRLLCKLEKDDLVRIALDKDIFAKGYRQNFSDDIYKVVKSISTDTVCYYVVKSPKGELLNKYYQELQLVGHGNRNNSTSNN